MVDVDQDQMRELLNLLRLYRIHPQEISEAICIRLSSAYGELSVDGLQEVLRNATYLMPTEELRLIFPILLGIDEPAKTTLSVRRTKAAYLAGVDVRTVMRREGAYMPFLAYILLVLPQITPVSNCGE